MNCGTAYIYGDLNTQETYIVGQIIIWPNSSNLPPGFLSCNGTEISRTTYKLLFDEIGTKFGTGDGSTTFSLPLLNNMDTSNFSLAKGDNNMTSSSNTLNTDLTNLTRGGNTINTTITHEHNIITNIIDISTNSINYGANANYNANNTNIEKRGIITGAASTTQSGAKNTDYYVEWEHSHNIIFNISSNNYNFSASEDININTNTSSSVSGSQSSVVPLSLKVHYLIYSGVFNI